MIDALPLLLSDEGYQISRSVRLRSSASAYFNRTMAAGSAVTVYTFSAWVKRGELGTIKPIVQGYLNNNNYGHIIFKADNTIEWREVSVAANYGQVNTNAVFRDPSAWYHIVVVRNGTSLLIYVNGVSQTLTVSTAVNAAGGYLFGASTAQRIGSDQVNSAFFDGYLTECYLIDGQALTPSSFGETNAVTGVWQPKKYTGTYGTNGFYLNFSDNSAATAAAIGADYSGNGNNWTPNNISVTAGVTYDSMLDVPTQWADGGNGRGNYSTMNPLDYVAAAFSGTASNGNLTISIPAPTNSNGLASTIRVVSAAQSKFYIETTVTSLNTVCSLGMISGTNANYRLRHTADITLAVNDVVMTAFDPATGKVWYGRNGTWLSSGNPAAGTNQWDTIPSDQVVGSAYSILATNVSTGTFTTSTTFGQQPFAYTPPTGFKALNTLNLPTPTILKGNQYFDATTYTGNSGTQSVVNSGAMQPDLVWIKDRSAVGQHVLTDSVRGVDRQLFSSLTNAEQTSATGITSLNSNGFTTGANPSPTGATNSSPDAFIAWQWKEGATQGFDIVTYTGTGVARTVAHSLGVAPDMMIVKQRSGVQDWIVYHKSIGNTGALFLQATSATATSALYWNNTSPNSSSFTVGTGNGTNANTATYVAYLFAEVAGFSRMGSYVGNGSADGPMIFTGFQPRFVMMKAVDATNANDWVIIDTTRKTSNNNGVGLRPNLSSAEFDDSGITSNGINIDVLSNGFKPRGTSTRINGSGSTVIYAAFASSPFKNSLAF